MQMQIDSDVEAAVIMSKIQATKEWKSLKTDLDANFSALSEKCGPRLTRLTLRFLLYKERSSRYCNSPRPGLLSGGTPSQYQRSLAASTLTRICRCPSKRPPSHPHPLLPPASHPHPLMRPPSPATTELPGPRYTVGVQRFQRQQQQRHLLQQLKRTSDARVCYFIVAEFEDSDPRCRQLS